MSSYDENLHGDTPVNLEHAPIDFTNPVALVHGVERCQERLEYKKGVPFVDRALESLKTHPEFRTKLVLFSAIFQDLTWGEENSWSYWQGYLERFFTAFEVKKEEVDAMDNELKGVLEEEDEEVKNKEPIDPFHGMVLFGALYTNIPEKDAIFRQIHHLITIALLYGHKRAGAIYIFREIAKKRGVVSPATSPRSSLSRTSSVGSVGGPTPTSPVTAAAPGGSTSSGSGATGGPFVGVVTEPVYMTDIKGQFNDPELEAYLKNNFPVFRVFDALMDESKYPQISNIIEILQNNPTEMNLKIGDVDFSNIRKSYDDIWIDKTIPGSNTVNKLVIFRVVVLCIIRFDNFANPIKFGLSKEVLQYLDQVAGKEKSSRAGILFIDITKMPKSLNDFMKNNKKIIPEVDYITAYNVSKSERGETSKKNWFVKYLLTLKK